MRLRIRSILILALAYGPLATAEDPPAAATEDLVEETTSRLAQIDVTVGGPIEAIAAVESADFHLKIHTEWITDFRIDRQCEARAPQAAAEPSIAAPGTSYLLYFDQPHLTLAGRQRSIDMSHELIVQLIRNGNRARIISNARRLITVEEFTSDPDRLHDALERLRADRSQWSTYASEEHSRVARIVEVLSDDDDIQRAISTARSFQREEHFQVDKNLRRLAATLGTLSEISERKAVIYFADTLRANAGAHYLSFFGSRARTWSESLRELELDAFAAGSAMDIVLNEAASQGIRIYSVLAQGLVVPMDDVVPGSDVVTRTESLTASSSVRFNDTQNTLANMATETGGVTFLRGDSARQVGDRIVQDEACTFTFSFDPSGLPVDEPLRVMLDTDHKELKLRSAGMIVIRSDSARLASRLTNAFALDDANDANAALQANLVPTDFSRGKYTALLQVSVPGSTVPGASWDLGATVIVRDKVLHQFSGTLAVRQLGVPLILEHELTLGPGPHEIVAVAHETRSGSVLSERVSVSWPDPNGRPVTCSPIALLQPTTGAFVRSGETRTKGSLARSVTDLIDGELPVALMGLVCRGRRFKGVLRVERTLIGGTAVDFSPLEVQFDDERCAQVRDLVPAHKLGAGRYIYRMRVLRDDTLLDEVSREFLVAGPGQPGGPGAASGDGGSGP